MFTSMSVVFDAAAKTVIDTVESKKAIEITKSTKSRIIFLFIRPHVAYKFGKPIYKHYYI